MKEEMWKPPIKDWEKISHQSYAFIFEQSKGRFEEIMSESETITSRALTLIGIYAGFLAGFLSLFFNDSTKKIVIWHPLLLGFLYIADIVLLISLLWGKRMVNRGSPPNEIFIPGIESSDYTEKDQLSFLYHNEISRYQARIDLNKEVNTKRHNIYTWVLILSIVIFIWTAICVINTFYYP